MNQIAIVDYGVGNLKSVSNALKFLGVSSVISCDVQDFEHASAIILPGVGAFPDAAERLRNSGLDRVVMEQGKRKPVLGICLGMQLLLTRGFEGRQCEGLSAVCGDVNIIPTQRKLPHIGWNNLHVHNNCPLFQGIDDGAYVYFVHSFSAQSVPEHQIAATTDYGGTVVAAVQNENFYGCQFHPEKSGETGLAILKNFSDLNR